ncbi:techylectin-5B-like [Pollicipes pollicipes]|uniref:techylectin-5B-like n=1 Tax=Pollicipes pollicipes TaxID=41117 RepID=UPI0018858770|nr:techylectin-5B-like [Pollicipes pollicipes]
MSKIEGQVAVSKILNQLLDMTQSTERQYHANGAAHVSAPLELSASKAISSNCWEVQQLGLHQSGLFLLRLGRGLRPALAYCDHETDGGGWTVIQQRLPAEPQLDFFLGWEAYKWGFGDLEHEFWLGNENIHLLTTSDKFELRVELEGHDGTHRYAHYERFVVAAEQDQYRVRVFGYSGDAGDSLDIGGAAFTTKDRDNDQLADGNCASLLHGGWWYSRCGNANLNGGYLDAQPDSQDSGVFWAAWTGYRHSLKSVRMMVRPASYYATRKTANRS